MALLDKPNMKEVWASGGAAVKPSDEKIQTGWTAEVPPYQYENWIQGRQDQYLAHVNQRGIPQWDGATEYEGGGLSYVQGSDGVVYKSVGSSGPSGVVQDPTTDVGGTYWEKAFSDGDLNQNIAVFDTAGVHEWTVPDVLRQGFRKAWVTVIGAGGSGGSGGVSGMVGGGGGGGGGKAIKLVDLTDVPSVTVTVGVGGAGASSGSIGANGEASSFGTLLSATGGTGGGAVNAGPGGVGVGGDINFRPSSAGTRAGSESNPAGGNGGGDGGSPGRIGADNSEDGLYGGGSGGAVSGSTGKGGDGLVIIQW